MPTGIYKHQKHTKERRKNISEALIGRDFSKEHRRKISENMSNENNHRWKGDNATKISLHKWIAKNKPKSKNCEYCNKERKLNLANMNNHNYTRNLDDYKWLCYSCHGHMDKNKEFCKNGHTMMGDNLIINNRGHRVCRECRKKYNFKYRIETLAGDKLV